MFLEAVVKGDMEGQNMMGLESKQVKSPETYVETMPKPKSKKDPNGLEGHLPYVV